MRQWILRVAVLSVLGLGLTSAQADVLPDPTDPATPTGAAVWLVVLTAMLAVVLLWYRRRK